MTTQQARKSENPHIVFIALISVPNAFSVDPQNANVFPIRLRCGNSVEHVESLSHRVSCVTYFEGVEEAS